MSKIADVVSLSAVFLFVFGILLPASILTWSLVYEEFFGQEEQG